MQEEGEELDEEEEMLEKGRGLEGKRWDLGERGCS
jgi:hypothetical protein